MLSRSIEEILYFPFLFLVEYLPRTDRLIERGPNPLLQKPGSSNLHLPNLSAGSVVPSWFERKTSQAFFQTGQVDERRMVSLDTLGVGQIILMWSTRVHAP